MTGNITHLPPPRSGSPAQSEREARIHDMMRRIVETSHVREAGQLLLDMGERWRCEAYVEGDREDLKKALRHLAEASSHLAKKLTNGRA